MSHSLVHQNWPEGVVNEGDLGVHRAWWGLNSPRGLTRLAVTSGIPAFAITGILRRFSLPTAAPATVRPGSELCEALMTGCLTVCVGVYLREFRLDGLLRACARNCTFWCASHQLLQLYSSKACSKLWLFNLHERSEFGNFEST